MRISYKLNCAWTDNNMQIAVLSSFFNSFKKKTKHSSENESKSLDGIKALEKGKKHFTEKQNRSALDWFDKAIEYGVEHEVYGLRAMCLQALDFHLDAIDDFNKAILLSPDDCNLYYMRSISKSAIGDVDGCVADLEEAVRLSKADNEMNRSYDIGAKEQGWNSVTDIYNASLFRESNLPLPESLRQRKKEKYSARRKSN